MDLFAGRGLRQLFRLGRLDRLGQQLFLLERLVRPGELFRLRRLVRFERLGCVGFRNRQGFRVLGFWGFRVLGF